MSLEIFNNIYFLLTWTSLWIWCFFSFFFLTNQRHAFKQFWSRGISWDIGYRTWMIFIQPNKRLKKYLMTISIVRMAVCIIIYLFLFFNDILEWDNVLWDFRLKSSVVFAWWMFLKETWNEIYPPHGFSLSFLQFFNFIFVFITNKCVLSYS